MNTGIESSLDQISAELESILLVLGDMADATKRIADAVQVGEDRQRADRDALAAQQEEHDRAMQMAAERRRE